MNLQSEIIKYGELMAVYILELNQSSSPVSDSVLEADAKVTDQLNKLKCIIDSIAVTRACNDENVIRQFEKYFSAYPPPHVIVDENLTPDEWNQKKCPFTWKLVETKDEHTVYIDHGYGFIALFENGVLVDCAKEVIAWKNVVVVSKDYYGTPKYIWK